MDTIYKVRKINETGKHRTPGGKKFFNVGDIHICVNEAEYNHLMTYDTYHWEDAMPVEAKPEPKPAPKKKQGKKGAK